MNLAAGCLLILVALQQWKFGDSWWRNNPRRRQSFQYRRPQMPKQKQKSGTGPLINLVELTAEQKKEFVDAHNQARASVNPPAADMTKLVWDDDIAAVSQKIIKKCRFIHSDTSERTTNDYPQGMGENLFVGMSQYHIKPAYITERWDAEREYYHIHGTSCDPGKVCGHYTQVVWSTTRKIGCGMAKCSRVEGTSRPIFDLVAVCHYGPPGNYRGVQPYKIGKTCSECPADATICVNDLCSAEI